MKPIDRPHMSLLLLLTLCLVGDSVFASSASTLFSQETGSILEDSAPPVESAAKESSDKDEDEHVLPTVEAFTEDCELRQGLFSVYLRKRDNRVFLRLNGSEGPFEDLAEGSVRTRDANVVAEFLYVQGLSRGLGSNPVGLDRGKLGEARVLRLRRLGRRVFFEQPNLGYRALSSNIDEVNATAESFAESVLWAGDVVAEAALGTGAFLVDVTDFIVRDAFGVARDLKNAGQGDFSVNAERSAFLPASLLAFPDNLEFEALLTFAGSNPGSELFATSPDANSVSLVQHHSFVRLPDNNYQPRRSDPRAGHFSVNFFDYAAALEDDPNTSWAVRHRLQRSDLSAESSPAVEPIVYYLDRGAPEPVRSALMDGAAWWNDAFEAAGFEDAFRVELMPEGAHPLDVRYNFIQWVHRATRGWSYGGGVIDPRTGEMIKGHVSLGSLRVRQDIQIFEGLGGSARTGTGLPNDPIRLSLARLRQLAAHEVGHTLGLSHNFAASTQERGSVMDYPAPLISVDGEELDFSRAYGVGVGEWDRHAISWLYSDFEPEREEVELADLTERAQRRGLIYLSDADARPTSASDARGSLWDNGADAARSLEQVLAVRSLALDRFDETNLAFGRPLARLEELLAPVYFYHRYQLEAAIKLIGGVEYDHEMVGRGTLGLRHTPPETQERALVLALKCVHPDQLDLPDRVLRMLLPRPPGWSRNREQFTGFTAPHFDPLAAASAAADLVFQGILNPSRCARLVEQHRRNSAQMSLSLMLSICDDALFDEPSVRMSERHSTLIRTVQASYLEHVMKLSDASGSSPAVRAAAEADLARLLARVGDWELDSIEQREHQAWVVRWIAAFTQRDFQATRSGASQREAPPGSPIGSGGRTDLHGRINSHSSGVSDVWGACCDWH